MKSSEIRQSFYDFFATRNHKFVRSAPVIPFDDPTLLFINAGMNQFKPVFLEEVKPAYPMVYNSQKCIRVSGKHNDLEEVGVDTFHHTFFEMLGNWSFGEYYKKDAIKWAWEWMTDVLKLDKSRLWVTVYKDDDEAAELWETETDIPRERILKFGKKDNFWEMGDTGPCGPCSEIHYYIGDDTENQSADGVNASEEYWELWNLVFIQYNRDEKGKLNDLPCKHIDTGAGVERITAACQGKKSNYDTDLFMPIIRKMETLSGKTFSKNEVPFRVIADHIRMLCFSIADGGMPSNDGRGYVIRRILRRALRFGRILGQKEPFLYNLVDIVSDVMGAYYPEIVQKQAHIRNVIRAEEISFNETLDRGLNHFDKVIARLKSDIIPGIDAFKLYDTYGFPLDLTQLLAREKGLIVDEAGFTRAMDKQKARAKAAGKFRRNVTDLSWNIVRESGRTEFTGYEFLETTTHIARYAFDKEQILIILESTPFYAESGGQVGDTGTLKGDGIDLAVVDTRKDGDLFVHYCMGTFSEESSENEVLAKVDIERRNPIKLNHTATHLLHAALKQVLGDHVHQAGSLVSEDYLRFDLTHFEKIKIEELRKIEEIINEQILLNRPVDTDITSYDNARKGGAEALFGEKYGDKVRVLTIGDFSKELCGGTHVQRTGDIGSFRIIEESALAAGVRRIIGVTGKEAYRWSQANDDILLQIQSLLNVSGDAIPARIKQLIDQRSELEKKLKNQSLNSDMADPDKLYSSGINKGEFKFIVKELPLESMDELKMVGDKLIEKFNRFIAILTSEAGEKPKIAVAVSHDLVKKGVMAGQIASEIGRKMGAGGGGKPHLATCGTKDLKSFSKGLEFVEEIVDNLIKGTGLKK